MKNTKTEAKKLVFLITDGFSNGNDPRNVANLLKSQGVEIFTFGIQMGNIKELQDIASEPVIDHCYFLQSFMEFRILARKALHRGKFILLYTVNHDKL